jgi:hypothetical protein
VISIKCLSRRNKRYAKLRWGNLLGQFSLTALVNLTEQFHFCIANGDLLFLDNGWYVTHSGLTNLARRNKCAGIEIQPVQAFCDPLTRHWAFKATVYKSRVCKGFGGYGDADPSNVSAVVLGAEMRVAETRAVNRALRKAYGIGICSIEEIGSSTPPLETNRESQKFPPQPANATYGAPKVRDRLCQIIRKHTLDPNLVKAYATDFCGVTELRDATREHVENFVKHLADWAEKDRDALLCQLNSYPSQKEGAA